MKKILVLCLLLALTGCASIEGTRDKSLTLNKSQLTKPIASVAILPIKENAVYVGLSSKIENDLYYSLVSQLRGVDVLNGQKLKYLLEKGDMVDAYSLWLSGYDSTSILNKQKLAEIGPELNVDYFLLVRSVSLTREKIRGVDTGMTGMVSDAKNVYRSDLKIYAELIDVYNGVVVWKGVGHSENINSPRKDLDLILIIKHEIEPGVQAVVDELVKVATSGMANELMLFAKTYLVSRAASRVF